MNKFTGEFDYGYASALAVIATLMMMLIALIYIKLSKIGKDGVLG
jgi:multiple sugar transport system permease protein